MRAWGYAWREKERRKGEGTKRSCCPDPTLLSPRGGHLRRDAGAQDRREQQREGVPSFVDPSSDLPFVEGSAPPALGIPASLRASLAFSPQPLSMLQLPSSQLHPADDHQPV